MLQENIRAVSASVLALVFAVSLGAPGAMAASVAKHKHATTQHVHHAYFIHRARPLVTGDNGRYRDIPPNAIRMPGYIFVPGVGILGEFVRSADQLLLERIPRHPVKECRRARDISGSLGRKFSRRYAARQRPSSLGMMPPGPLEVRDARGVSPPAPQRCNVFCLSPFFEKIESRRSGAPAPWPFCHGNS